MSVERAGLVSQRDVGLLPGPCLGSPALAALVLVLARLLLLQLLFNRLFALFVQSLLESLVLRVEQLFPVGRESALLLNAVVDLLPKQLFLDGGAVVEVLAEAGFEHGYLAAQSFQLALHQSAFVIDFFLPGFNFIVEFRI